MAEALRAEIADIEQSWEHEMVSIHGDQRAHEEAMLALGVAAAPPKSTTEGTDG